MDIRLIPVGSGQKFTFPALPEKLKGKYGAKYQSFDIISQGTVKVPRGTDVTEVTWDGVFFGRSKRHEAIVREEFWQEPNDCVRILQNYMQEETVLNLIVTETWINMDVTVSSFMAAPVGAYGNIEYSIAFAQKKPLRIYDTSELQIAAFSRQTRPRNDGAGSSGSGVYVVRSGDTLSGIAARKCGGARNWIKLYEANAGTIEATARARGKSGSDHGHWIFPGEQLQLV